jgi:2-alkenal reductase
VPLAGVETAFERVYQQVSPSVVAIRVVQKQTVQIPAIPEIPGFRFFGPPGPGTPGRQYRYRQGLGSGFVWDKQGDIVTNNHVVDGADRIFVTFSDDTTVPGRLVGTDPSSDLAVIRVDVAPDKLRPVGIADSTRLKVGQLAIAIGNPFGEQNTMTTGIVSAVGRSLPAPDGSSGGPTYTIPDVIQTDAPINPGNSGGVLLDAQGRAIGVTSAIESPVGVSSGIGFAIPSAIVQRVVPALIQTGHDEHPWLGVSGVSLTPDLAKAMGLAQDQRGALVVDVSPNSPADAAHLRGSDRPVTIDGEQARVGGDVIVAFDGHPIRSFDDLVAYLVRNTTVGQTARLTVLRGGKEQALTVKLAARPRRSQ